MKKTIIIMLGFLLLTGCTLIPKPDVNTAVYNFVANTSPQATQIDQPTVKSGKKILIANVTVPLWLDTPAIQYRLDYHNTARSYTYANSRWSSPPAFLLTQQIKQRIAADTRHLVIKDSSVAIAEYELHIELEAFTHVFSTPSDSHVLVRFRASLVNNAHRMIAQKIFSTTHAAVTPDAPGAVDAFTAASGQLTDSLVDWLNASMAHDN